MARGQSRPPVHHPLSASSSVPGSSDLSFSLPLFIYLILNSELHTQYRACVQYGGFRMGFCCNSWPARAQSFVPVLGALLLIHRSKSEGKQICCRGINHSPDLFSNFATRGPTYIPLAPPLGSISCDT